MLEGRDQGVDWARLAAERGQMGDDLGVGRGLEDAAPGFELLSQGLLAMFFNNELVYATNHELLQSMQLRMALSEVEQLSITPAEVKGSRYVTGTIRSAAIEDARYLIVLPRSRVLGSVDRIQFLVILALLICAVAGLLASLSLAYLQYKPLKDVLENLPAVTGQSGRIRMGTGRIRRGFRDLVTENQSMRHDLDLRKELSAEALLQHLQHGMLTEERMSREYLAGFGIEFPYERFAVLCFAFDDASGSVERAISRSLVRDIFVRQLPDRFAAQSIPEDSQTVIVLNYGGGAANTRDTIVGTISTINDFTRSKGIPDITTGVSSLSHTGVSSVPIAYREASYAARYRVLTGHDIYFFDRIQRDGALYRFPTVERQYLKNCLLAADTARAFDLLQRVLHDENDIEDLHVQVSLGLFHSILSSILEVLSAEVDREFLTTMQLPNRMAEVTQGRVSIETELRKVTEQVCNYLRHGRKGTGAAATVARIEDHITASSADINLSLASIGDALGLTPAYISRVYKECTGEYLHDSVNRIRIEQAKQLIRGDGDTALSRIGRSCGFANENTFIRIFKKHEGVTPGQFRASCRS